MERNLFSHRTVSPAARLRPALCIVVTLFVVARVDALAAQLVIRHQGAHPFGGKVVGDPARGTIHCDHGYVEWQIPQNPRWSWFTRAARKRGTRPSTAETGGNTHFPMLDLNNVKIADLLSRFLKEQRLDRTK